jgi:hypothetical protein
MRACHVSSPLVGEEMHYDFQLLRGQVIVATGHLAFELTPTPGERLHVAGYEAVVRRVDPPTPGSLTRVILQVIGQ